jgi:hypothetical protein
VGREVVLTKDLLIFTVDLNEMDRDGRYVVASRWRVSSPRVPEVGERVWLHDADGEECEGIVATVGGRTVLIEPIWDSLKASSDLLVTGLPLVGAALAPIRLDCPPWDGKS